MTARTFFVLASTGLLGVVVGCEVDNVALKIFSFILMLLSFAAVIKQSEV